jgi:hypothetical protein
LITLDTVGADTPANRAMLAIVTSRRVVTTAVYDRARPATRAETFLLTWRSDPFSGSAVGDRPLVVAH